MFVADRGDVTFILNVDQFAHENTLERDKSVPSVVVPDLSRIIQDALSRLRVDIVDMVGEKLKTDSRFRNLLDKHDLVSRFGDRYTKVAKREEIFDYKDLAKKEWFELLKVAQKSSGIYFDTENNEPVSSKNISIDTPELSFKSVDGKMVNEKMRFRCELCSAGGDWQHSTFYFKCQKYDGDVSVRDGLRFCLIPDKSHGNNHLVEEDGKFFPCEYDKDVDLEEKDCWDALPGMLSGFVKQNGSKKMASDTSVEYNKVPMVGRLNIQAGSGSYGVLDISEDFKRSVFEAIKTSGMQYDHEHGAHISVFTDEELDRMPEVISEVGKMYPFFLRSIESVNPDGWDEVERVWFVRVESKELEELRKKYGLSPKVHGDHDFHITIAVKPSRKNKRGFIPGLLWYDE
jgi:hypothetical protein